MYLIETLKCKCALVGIELDGLVNSNTVMRSRARHRKGLVCASAIGADERTSKKNEMPRRVDALCSLTHSHNDCIDFEDF